MKNSPYSNMKHLLLICAVVALVGCGKKGETSQNSEPPKLINNPIVEKAIREELQKPQGELTQADLEKVVWLDLTGTEITDAGLKEVATLHALWLYLNGCDQITDAGLKELAKMQKLRGLALNSTKITDTGLKEVAKMQQVTVLWLHSTQITDAGLKDVVKLQQLTNLDLRGCIQITDAGAAELRKALPKCEIRQ